jgi:hypothetical protein
MDSNKGYTPAAPGSTVSFDEPRDTVARSGEVD